LGIVFTVFGIIPTFIIGLIGVPLIFGGTMAGGLTGLGISSLALILIAIVVQGWFVYWFVTSNKFRK
jgi:hypothetical protein